MTLFGRHALTAFVALLLLSNCSSTKVMSEWQADDGVAGGQQRVAVVAMMPEALQRLTVEQEIVRVLRKAGRNALVSSDIPGLAGRLSRTRAEPALQAASVEAVIVVFITGGGKGENLKRSEVYTAETQADYRNPGFNWFSPQFGNAGAIRKGTEFFAQQSYAYVESTYFDIADGRAVWSVITRTKNAEYSDAAKSVAEEIVARMKSSGTF